MLWLIPLAMFQLCQFAFGSSEARKLLSEPNPSISSAELRVLPFVALAIVVVTYGLGWLLGLAFDFD